MKLMKKLLTVFIAFAMAFAVFALSACDEFLPDNGNDTENGDGDQNKEPVKESELLQAVLNDDRRSVEIVVTENAKGFEELYNFDSESCTVGELIESTQIVVLKNVITGKANLDDGDLDGALTQWYNFKGEIQSGEAPIYIRSYQGFLPDEEEGYMYMDETAYEYVRWLLDRGFNIDLPYLEDYPEDITESDINDAMSNMFFRFFKAENYTLLKLADNYGLLDVQGDKATVDVNKLAYNMLTDAKAYLETLDEATTIGEILKNDTVKKILLPVTEVMDAVDMRNVLIVVASYYGLFNFMSQYELDTKLIDDALGIPEEGANAYEYLLSVVSSEKLRTAVNAILKKVSELEETEYEELPWTVDKVPLDYILEICGAGEGAFTEFKNEKLEFITEILKLTTESVFAVSAGEGTNNVYSNRVTNASIEFTLDSKGVASQKITADYNYTYGGTVYQQPDKWQNNVDEEKLEAVINYSSKPYELENIDGMKFSRYEYDALESETKEITIPVEGATQPVTVKLQSVVEDNSITSVNVFTSDGEQLEVTEIPLSYGNIYYFLLKVNCIDSETGETVETDVPVLMQYKFSKHYFIDRYYIDLRIDMSLEFDFSYFGRTFEIVYFEPPIYEITIKGYLNGDPFVPKSD